MSTEEPEEQYSDAVQADTDMLEESTHSGNNTINRSSSYRQKYKHAWELNVELRDWLTAHKTDAYAAYCKFCRVKLHAHKKGLVAHSRSAKHKKHVDDPELAVDEQSGGQADLQLALMQSDSMNMDGDRNGDSDGTKPKRSHKGPPGFHEKWLTDPLFSPWLRKVPTNRSKALCIACRCVITAGRCELVKHTRALKHQKAMQEGPFEEMTDIDLRWLAPPSLKYDSNFGNDTPSGMVSLNQQTNQSMMNLPGLMVDEIVNRLNDHVPLDLAESWDNVGVITKPTMPIRIYNILLTIDLNMRIVEEAIKKRAQFIISYHPPIFSAIKKLNPSAWKDRAILMCIENKIAVYSPHTSLDAVKGGINDWLISPFINGDESLVRPITYCKHKANSSCLEVLMSETQETAADIFKGLNNVEMTQYGETSTDVRVTCNEQTLPVVVEQVASKECTQLSSRVTQLVPMPIPGVGMGRIVTFSPPLPLYEVVQRVKTLLDLTYVRLALSPKHTRDTKIGSIGVCAGSGTSILKGTKADLWITGEMSHHDVLDAIHTGITVILCEHSNTERGFLRDWSQQLRNSVFEDQVIVTVSELDKDPLRIV